MRYSEDLLVESKAARNDSVSQISAQSRADEVLNKVKALMFAVWDGTPRVVPEQVAEFYDVPVETIDSNYDNHKDEFELDGVKVFSGKALREVKGILPLSSSARHKTIYTPAGVLRMGFILRDSEVAKQVRTVAIRIIEGVANLIDSRLALEALVQGHTGAGYFADSDAPKISAPLFQYYESIKRELKKSYPVFGIRGFTTDKIREVIAYLSTWTDNWKLQTAKEIKSSHAASRYGYPHLTSDVFSLQLGGQTKTAVIMFQFYDVIVDDRDIAEVDGTRRYIRLAKTTLGVDLAWLFFVAPFGATPAAVSYIQSELRDDSKGFVGVLTVKDLAQFLHSQACLTRSTGFIKGEINTRFANVMDYEIPDSPLMLLMEYQLPLIEASESS